MEINWRGIGFFILCGLILIAAEGLVYYANAEESSVVVESPFVDTNASTELTQMIQQGDLVALNETVDISGVVPPYPQLAYWNGYDMYDTIPTYNITLPDNKEGYYHYYINPEIFSTRLGKWYKYDGKFESNSNNLAFIVVPFEFHNNTMTFPNGTVINQSEIIKNETLRKLLNPTPEILPQKRESDYLITTEESFNITVNRTSAMWLFNGEDNSILYSVGESEIVYNQTNISHLQPGEYTLLIQTIGNNTQGFDVLYTNHTIKWFNQRSFTITELDTTSMVPEVAINTLKEIFPQTRDGYVIKRLSVQQPTVIISQMNEIYAVSAKTYYNDPSRRGNVSVMDVRGYVNTLPKNNITVKLDAANTYIKDAKFTTFDTTAIGDYDGNWRQWKVEVPFYWDALDIGMHTITARSALGGGTAYADFPIGILPEDSFVPKPTIKYVGDRNPWVAPVTVEVPVTVTVVQTIMVPVTPSQEEVNAAQLEAARVIKEEEDRKTNDTIWLIVTVIVVGALLLGSAWYGISVFRRARKE